MNLNIGAGSKVRVVAGRCVKKLSGYIGEVDASVGNSNQLCVTFTEGHGEEQKRASVLFYPDELSVC